MKTQAEITTLWKAKGFSCDLWTDPPGQRWENYEYTVDELTYIIKGVLELEVKIFR